MTDLQERTAAHEAALLRALERSYETGSLWLPALVRVIAIAFADLDARLAKLEAKKR